MQKVVIIYGSKSTEVFLTWSTKNLTTIAKMNISAQMTKFLQSNLFDLGDLDLGQPLGECVCAEGLLEGRESERLVALS